MNLFNKSLADISCHKYIRIDCKYWSKIKEINFSKFNLLKDIFYIIKGSVQTENYVLGKTSIPYVRISDIELKYGVNLSEAVYLDEDTVLSTEKLLRKDDLIVAIIGTVGKVSLAGDAESGTYSNNTVVLRAKKTNTNMKFYEKLLQSDYYINYLLGVVSQKAQPNLQLYDLQNIKLPIVEESKILFAVNKITSIENQIADLKKGLKDVQSIVDEVLQKEFNFDYDKFNQLKKVDRFNMPLDCFALNPDLRFSAKFHRPAGDFVMQELLRITSKKFKHFLAEPIVLGASISPSDFDENGDFYYISMATIKNYSVETDDSQLVSQKYALSNLNKKIQKNDIIMNRSGVAIGKVALVEDNEKGIFADFTMRIRFERYNQLFAYYYMRSSYFQYLIEIYKKGLQNQNIFPIVVREFPLIDIPLAEQQRIVEEIQTEIDKQIKIKNSIAKLRSDIDQIIENAMSIEKTKQFKTVNKK